MAAYLDERRDPRDHQRAPPNNRHSMGAAYFRADALGRPVWELAGERRLREDEEPDKQQHHRDIDGRHDDPLEQA
jgi:hypothetical protein